MSKTSKWWPYIRAIGKAFTIPGTKIGAGILVDMQDKLDAAEHGAMVKNALEDIRRNTAMVVELLRREQVQEPDHAIKKVAEVLYLDERIAKVKIAPGTTVQVLANAVSSFDAQPAAASKTDKELADLKEAKATADKK